MLLAFAFMSTIGLVSVSIAIRLREERSRLKLTQTEAAKAGGIGFTAYQGYERGDRWPNGECLALWASAGFDVLYILTAQRNSSELSSEESAVLASFAQLDERGKHFISDMIQAYNKAHS